MEQVKRKIQQCRVGPFPELDDEEDGEEDEEEESWSLEIEEGDQVFMMVIHLETHQIWATRNIFQRLAEAYFRNTQVKSFPDVVSDYLHEFKDVFSEEAYDKLLEWKQWDHAVELIPGAVAKGCKVYPLSPAEQKAMDEFLVENLEIDQICPSKSPMAAPCFFIKKKDGQLHLIQDYWFLNEITVKNRYPLLLISELVDKLKAAKYFIKLDVW